MSYIKTNEQWNRAYDVVETIKQRDALNLKLELLEKEMAVNWIENAGDGDEIVFVHDNTAYVFHYLKDNEDGEPHVYVRTKMKALHA